MPKNEKILEIGSYRVAVRVEETRALYAPMHPEGDAATAYFRHLLSRASAEGLAFLRSLGIEPFGIPAARPLTEPDERGEILYLAHAPFRGQVLAGGDTEPRQSEEIASLSVIFVQEKEGEGTLRFLIPLPFDASYFQ